MVDGLKITKNFLHDEKNFAVGFIEDINENHTDTTVDFEITLSEEAAKNLQDGDALFKMFKLESSISVTNMTCFDRHRKIRTFKSPEEILFDFFSNFEWITTCREKKSL